MNRIELLYKAYRYIGGKLCDELGHDWETLGTTPLSGGMNASDIQRCHRCHDKRLKPINTNTTTSDITVEVS